MKIFISTKNNKFIKNIVLSQIPGLDIISGHYQQQLYKIHQHHKINSYLFSLDDLDAETLQFIVDYHSKIKIFIYHNALNEQIIEHLSGCYHLSKDNYSSSNFIQIPQLINTHIFYNQKREDRNQQVVSFIDHLDNISSELAPLLYPNNKQLNIKMYGGTFGHMQNLGLASEIDKANILNSNTSFLSLDTSYIPEALLCGCDVYTTESIQNNLTINDRISLDYQTYSEFLTNILV